MSKVVKILSWNVNGIRAVSKKDALWPLVEKESPDIVCLQETKISSEGDFPKDLRMQNYELLLSRSKEKKGYSGVAILSKVKPLYVKKGFGIEKFDVEGRVLEAGFDEFILFSVYFPNGKMSQERLDYKMEFYEKFREYVEFLRQAGKRVVICGDVNTAHEEIDLARPKENVDVSGFLKMERDWISHFLALGWFDSLRELHPGEEGLYTWWAQRAIGARERNVGWRIDYFFLSESLREYLKDAFILPQYKGSDHCPLGVVLSFD
ncbi:MAG: exodeoxyribonuclease III [Candidatus Woesearchaeota archaeon]|nr:exodeoxyribonuclease III [Nanoarchaeota archaeon]USN44287.1 MAG: exodeoxyribonuclease III [Candidatus Woesearchaeota archaeon]